MYCDKQSIKRLLFALSRINARPGAEHAAGEEIRRAVAETEAEYGVKFDEVVSDGIGNIAFVRRCGVKGAPLLLVDAHMDEIGMIVTNISEDGFLSVASVGGIDTRVLSASDMLIFGGEKTLRGVVVSTPPHLIKGDRRAAPALDAVRIDTGCTKAELEAAGVRIGSTVLPYSEPFAFNEEFGGDFVCGKAFDDRVSAACAIVAALSEDALACDVMVALTAQEETGAELCSRLAYRTEPDFALVVDVGFDNTPDTPGNSTVKSGNGPIVSVSAVTDRALTDDIRALCDRCRIKYKPIVEATGTGTDADGLILVRTGIPTAVVGTPLRNMHTQSEVVRLRDCESLAQLIAAVMRSGSVCAPFAHEGYPFAAVPTDSGDADKAEDKEKGKEVKDDVGYVVEKAAADGEGVREPRVFAKPSDKKDEKKPEDGKDKKEEEAGK